MQIAFTGAFDAPGYPAMTRPALCRVAAAANLTVKSAVTKSVGYLVAADDSINTTKARQARLYGITIISYSRFVDTVNERLNALGRREFLIHGDRGPEPATGGRILGRINTFGNVPDAGRMATRAAIMDAAEMVVAARHPRAEALPLPRTAIGRTGGKRALDI